MIHLSHRTIVAIAGADRHTFLNGLISNNSMGLTSGQLRYAVFLTPQGRFLFDLFFAEDGERLLLDVEAARAEDFMRRLRLFKLRSAVEISAVANLAVHAQWEDIPIEKPGIFRDPRLSAMGWRAFLPADARTSDAALPTYHHHRIGLGVPESGLELVPQKSIPLENGLDELNAIDWEKGCYMGQELTARTRYRGLVRKRLLPLRIEGQAPAPGETLMLGTTEAGTLMSVSPMGDIGLGMIRLEHLPPASVEGLTAGQARLFPSIPAWMRLPEPQPTD